MKTTSRLIAGLLAALLAAVPIQHVAAQESDWKL